MVRFKASEVSYLFQNGANAAAQSGSGSAQAPGAEDKGEDHLDDLLGKTYPHVYFEHLPLIVSYREVLVRFVVADNFTLVELS